MFKRWYVKYIVVLVALILTSGGYYFYVKYLKPVPPLEEKFVTNENSIRGNNSAFEQHLSQEETKKLLEKNDTNSDIGESFADENNNNSPEESLKLATPPSTYEISQKSHTYQTFNNCGPATLSMFLSYFNISVDQKTLGDQMRPYQHPEGDNDDKTIFPYEFTDWAIKYGEEVNLAAITRPNGSIEQLKYYISNDIPVVAKTWLNKKEDIGHFIIVRGYDDNKQQVLVDDSYYGSDRKYSYYDFLSLWQPFNYSYIVGYDNSKSSLVNTILSSEKDVQISWQNAVTRALQENEKDPDSIYPLFNLSVGYYHLDDYEKSVQYFERVEDRLPKRMLWYQIEPIKAYAELGQDDRVLQITQEILDNDNRAFSELYYIRGQIYLKQGKEEEAKEEYEKAVEYNKYYQPAIVSLENL